MQRNKFSKASTYILLFLTLWLMPVVCLAVDNLALKYSTYHALGNSSASISDIAVDEKNNIYVTGESNYIYSTTNTPVTNNAFGDPQYRLSQGYVVKLSATNELIYSAYLKDADISAIDVDQDGRVYIVGRHKGGINPPYCETAGMFIARLSADGSTVEFCTNFFPNIGSDEPPNDIALDQNGDIYITGTHTGSYVPVTTGVYQSSGAGLDDAYVIKFSGDGSQVLTAFYLGGTGRDEGVAIEIGSDGIIYVAGTTNSSDFPLSNTLSGSRDIFLAKISNDGSTISHSRLYGGTGSDDAKDIKIDSSGVVYLAGNTNSNDFPTTSNSYQTNFGEIASGVILKIGSDGLIQYSTYLGTVSNIYALDVDLAGNAYVTGDVGSPYYPVTPNAFQEIFPVVLGTAFLSKISSDGTELLYSTYLGGNDDSNGYFEEPLSAGHAVKIKPDGQLVVAGYTNSLNFPVSNDALLKTSNIATSHTFSFISIFDVSALTITSPVLIDSLTMNESYEYTFTAEGGMPPYEWNATQEYLPTGTVLNSNGFLSGEIIEPFNYSKLYRYQDLTGIYDYYPIMVGVKDQNNDIFYKEVLAYYNIRPHAWANIEWGFAYTGNEVVLDGSGSYDREGDMIYSWRQISGTNALIINGDKAVASFIAPSTSEILTFELTVTDSNGVSDTDTDSIEVVNLAGSDVTNNSRGGSGSLSIIGLILLVLFQIFLPKITILNILPSNSRFSAN